MPTLIFLLVAVIVLVVVLYLLQGLPGIVPQRPGNWPAPALTWLITALVVVIWLYWVLSHVGMI